MSSVDVIIACRDAGATLPATLASLDRQSTKPGQVLVVDDGSVDEGTLALLRDVRDPVRVVRGPGAGPGAARNVGFAHSTAGFLLVLDADDQVAPRFIERTLSALQARPACGFAYTDLEYFGERRGVHRQLPYNFHDQLFRNQVSTCALIRREAWEAAGGYCEEMPFGGEDWEFFVSLGAAGWHGVRVPDVLFRYRVRAGTLSASTRRELPEIARFMRRRHADLYGVESLRRIRREWKGMWRKDDPESVLYRVGRFLRTPDRPRAVREAMERRGWGSLARVATGAWAGIRQAAEYRRTRNEPWRPHGDHGERRQRAVEWFRTHRGGARAATVVVSSHDDGEYLPDMLLSLAAQECGDFEVIVVDDGSTDAYTGGLLDELAGGGGDATKVVRRPRRGGLSAVRNEGVRNGGAPVIACVDADDILDPRFLALTLDRLASDPELGYAYFDYRKFGTVEDLVIAPDFDLARLATDNFVPACAPFRRSAWHDAGGYDEAMTGGFEDWDFWLRLAEHGWVGDRIPETLFYYRRRRGSLVEGAVRDRERWEAYLGERHAALFARVRSDPEAGT